jgi:hypothetical protein
LHFTGIQRETRFSPFHHAENDRLILELTAESLRRRGHSVQLLAEPDVGRRAISGATIFSMCQGPEANRLLEGYEQRGALVINSPRAVQGCYRFNLCRLAGAEAILAPTALVSTARGLRLDFSEGRAYWVKRGDVHATQAGDVARVGSQAEYLEVLEGLRRRGIDEAAVQEHVDGQVVKFYGVVGTPFFRYYAEGDFKLCPVAFGAARAAIERVVGRIGLEVYGGDAVLGAGGEIAVIDINDWPSFAYFRADAAEVIAGRIEERSLALLHGARLAEQRVRLHDRR